MSKIITKVSNFLEYTLKYRVFEEIENPRKHKRKVESRTHEDLIDASDDDSALTEATRVFKEKILPEYQSYKEVQFLGVVKREGTITRRTTLLEPNNV